MSSTALFNGWAATWAAFMLRGVIESSVLLAVVGLPWLVLRRRLSAQLSHGLFLLVLLKLAVPIPVPAPAWLARLTPRHAADRLVGWATTDGGRAPAGSWSDPFAPALPPPELRSGSPHRLAGRQASSHPVAPASGSGVSFASPGPKGAEASATQGMAGVVRRTRTPASVPSLSLSAVLMLAWGAVVFVLLVRLVLVHVRMHRHLRAAVLLEADSMPVDLRHLARLVGLGRGVDAFETSAVAAPAVWGWVRPRLLLPPGLAAELPPSQLSWALLHELVHIRRGDIWVCTLQRLVQAVYFFHPAAWLANWAIDAQREYACDDTALAVSGLPRRDCGAGLLTIVGRAHGLPAKTPALGLFRSEASIRRRLLRLLDTRRRLHRRLSLGASALLVALAVVVLPNVRAREEQGGPQVKAARASIVGIGKVPNDKAIVGDVVDADGKPAAGAKVWLVGMVSREGKTIVLGRTQADAEGRFALDSPRPEARAGVDDLGLWAYRPGAHAAWTTREPAKQVSLEGGANRLVLAAPAQARFRVLDAEGAPLPGARVAVHFVKNAGTYVPDELMALTSVETDAEGRATLRAFAPADPQGVVVTSPRFGRQSAMFRQGVVNEALIRLRRVGRVSGRVVADDAEAVRDLSVTIHSSPSELHTWEVYGEAETTTDDSGRFEVPAIAAGDLYVYVRNRGSSPYIAPVSVSARVGPGGLVAVDVRLAKAVRVKGEVRGKDSGRPLAGVRLRHFGPGRFELPPVETDANGRYEALAMPGNGSRWVGPPKGYLALEPGGSSPVTIGSEAEQTLPPIELSRGALLRGVVVGDDGKPVAGVTVEGKWDITIPIPGEREKALGRTFTASATSDDQGTFLLEGIHPKAVVTLEAHAAGARTERPQTAGAGEAEPVRLRISGANTVALAGRVVDSSGGPVAAALVRLRARPPGRDGWAREEPVRFGDSDSIHAGADGRFRTPRQLRRGYAYLAEAQAEGFMADITPWVLVGPGGIPDLPDMPLRRVRTVSGRVVDRSGRTVPGATVRQSGDGPTPTSTVADGQGRFTLTGVLEGRFFLFVNKPGYRPSWTLAGPDGTGIDVTIGRDNELGRGPLGTAQPALSRPEELALLHRIFDRYAEQVLKQGGPDRRWPLSILMRVDPARALDLIDAGGDAQSRDYERRLVALQLVAKTPDEAERVVKGMEDPDVRAWAGVSVAAALPAADRPRKRALLARALVDARAVDDPANRALKFASIGDALLDLGDVEAASDVLRQGEAVARELPKNGWAAFARRHVASALAPIDLAAALALLKGMEGDREHESALGNMAHELAGRAPADAERVLGMMRDEWPHFRDDYAQRVCYRMVTVDPGRARALAGRMKDYRAKARALGAMALALKGDPAVATGLVREAYSVLEQAVEEGRDTWNGLATASTAAAGLLSIAEQVDRRLLPEVLGRTLALRPPHRGPDTRDGIAALSHSQVAGAVARYDHEAARAVLDGCTGDLIRPILSNTEDNRNFYVSLLFYAAAVVDPAHAVALLGRLPEPAGLAMSEPTNDARLSIARVLADSGKERWEFIESRLLHVWQVDSEDE